MSRIQRLVRPGHRSPNWKLALPLLGLSLAGLSVYAQASLPAAGLAAAAVESPHIVVSAGGDTREHRSDRTDYALVNPDDKHSVRFVGHSDDLDDVQLLRSDYGNDFLWFRRDGQAYVVNDAAVLAQVRAAWKPTEPLSAEMDALGAQMDVHGKAMEELGRRMDEHAANGRPAAEKLEAAGARMDEVARQQETLAHRMAQADSQAERDQLAREMDALSAAMDERSREMDALSRELEAAHAPMEALGREMDAAGAPMEALGEQMEALGERMEAVSDTANRQTLALIDRALREGKATPVRPAAKH